MLLNHDLKAPAPTGGSAIFMSAQPLRSEKIGLNLLRGLAAIFVCVNHVRNGSFVEFAYLPPESRTLASKIFLGLCRLGHESVLVFFVLSGFLVGGALLERVMTGTFLPRHYAIDRVTRIWLPLLPACILTGAIHFYLTGETISFVDVTATLAGLNGVTADPVPSNGPLWSIAYEIWFYIFGGALGCVFLRGWRAALGIVLLVLTAVIFTKLEPRYLLFWLFGAVVATLPRYRGSYLLSMAGICSLFCGSLLFQLSRDTVSIVDTWHAPLLLSETLICAGIGLTLPALYRMDGFLAAFARPAAIISSASFSLYLTHAPVAEALHGIWPRQSSIDLVGIIAFSVKLAICLLFAFCFSLAFEQPTAEVRRFLRSRLRIRALAA